MGFNYPRRARQLIDFTGLTYKKQQPTDIDGLIEINDRYIVILEYKYNGAPVKIGQRLALTRLAQNCARAGKKTLALIADHYQSDEDIPIDAAAAIVREAWHGGAWHAATVKITVKDYVKKWINTKDYQL